MRSTFNLHLNEDVDRLYIPSLDHLFFRQKQVVFFSFDNGHTLTVLLV